MRTKGLLLALAAALVSCAWGSSAQAAWPTKTFAPYVYLDAGDGIQITNILAATGQKYYTLCFVIADSSGNPTWDAGSVSSGYYASQINSLRSSGGDIIISFGGAGGDELAYVTSSASTLQSKYQSVITKYNCTWLDFDIEGDNASNHTANHTRNTALKALQTANPGLQISFTLPADASGLDSNSTDLLSDAKSKGLVIRTVNAMTMDFGNADGQSESSVADQTAAAVHSQVNSIDSTIKIGMTPMIGQNDVKAEVFSESDAKTVLSFANANSYIDHLAFWSSDRDNGSGGKNSTASDTYSGIVQNTWDFTNIFKPFTSGSSGSGGFSGNYKIIDRNSGKAVVVQGASLVNNAACILYTYNGSGNDEWTAIQLSDGHYEFQNLKSGLAMVVKGASTTTGAAVIQYTFGGSNTNDEWDIHDLGTGYYEITNVNSSLALDVAGAGTANGTIIDQYTYHSGTNQQFQLISVP
jgi:chitinase